MRIAYQGAPGAYSEAAGLKYKSSADTLPCESFEDVFTAVERQTATHGIVPIENTVGGTIRRNYDLLLKYELPIVAEVQLPIVHNLVALPGTNLEDVRRIYSHPQALAQCERFLRSLENIEILATSDTAGSAKMIQEKQLKGAAALASERASEVFELALLKSGVQDFADNITRFLVISREAFTEGKPDKTTIVFTVPNEPGALFKALSVFALRGIDMGKLESRPIPGRPWEFLFFADLLADRQDFRCGRALMHLAEFAPYLRTLGSYSGWKDPEAESDLAFGADGSSTGDLPV
jgi:prephenate dehydratase